MKGEVGYIQITGFEEVTVHQFEEAYEGLKAQGMKGLVIDVRSNPGGLLTSVLEIGRMILPEGLIVYMEDKNGKRDEYTCDGENQIDIPLAVLVNGNSASASEILLVEPEYPMSVIAFSEKEAAKAIAAACRAIILLGT